MIIFNPSSLKKVALFLFNNRNFYRNNFDNIPFLNVYRATIPSNTVKKFTPSYDLFDGALKGEIAQAALQTENYYFGLVESLSIKPIAMYEPVDTYTWSKYISSPRNNQIKTDGSLSLPVILPFSDDFPNSKFLKQIWRLGVYWFVPFFLSTDVYPQNIGGPLFVRTFELKVTDNSNVSLDMSFVGGSADAAPESLYQDKSFIDFKNYFDTTNFSNFQDDGSDSYRSVFRTAKNYDCLLVLDQTEFPGDTTNNLGFNTTYGDLKQSMVVQGNNIIGMTLKIENTIEEIYTANDGVYKNITDGMRYISLKKRTVSGTIDFISTQNLQNYFSSAVNKSLVMYFGGPFYFPMKNVTFQVFSLEVAANNASYKHQVSFTALLQESNYQEYFNQNEFDFHVDGLYGPPTGDIYVKPQPAYKEFVPIRK